MQIDNDTCIIIHIRVLRREVFPGNGRVLGIQVDNSYISLPGELFENLNESGITLNCICMLSNDVVNFSCTSSICRFILF